MATTENLRSTPARMAGAGLYVRTHECGLFFFVVAQKKLHRLITRVCVCVRVCAKATGEDERTQSTFHLQQGQTLPLPTFPSNLLSISSSFSLSDSILTRTLISHSQHLHISFCKFLHTSFISVPLSPFPFPHSHPNHHIHHSDFSAPHFKVPIYFSLNSPRHITRPSGERAHSKSTERLLPTPKTLGS